MERLSPENIDFSLVDSTKDFRTKLLRSVTWKCLRRMFLPAQQMKLLLASYCMYELVRKISHIMMEACQCDRQGP